MQLANLPAKLRTVSNNLAQFRKLFEDMGDSGAVVRRFAGPRMLSEDFGKDFEKDFKKDFG